MARGMKNPSYQEWDHELSEIYMKNLDDSPYRKENGQWFSNDEVVDKLNRTLGRVALTLHDAMSDPELSEDEKQALRETWKMDVRYHKTNDEGNVMNRNPKLPVNYYTDDYEDVVVREHTRRLPKRKKVKSHEVEYKRLKRVQAPLVVDQHSDLGSKALKFEEARGGGAYGKRDDKVKKNPISPHLTHSSDGRVEQYLYTTHGNGNGMDSYDMQDLDTSDMTLHNPSGSMKTLIAASLALVGLSVVSRLMKG